jgi:hypothetical protein
MKQYIQKFFFSFLFLCIVSITYSQTAVTLNDNARSNATILKATDVNGAFLFSKDYLMADIVLANGKIIIGNKVRLNLQDNKLYYTIGPDEEMEVSMAVKQIIFGVQEGNKNLVTFTSGFPPVGKLTKDNFYQELVPGKVSLLLDTKFLQSTRVQVPVGPVTETTKLENYYGSNGTVTVKITKAEDLTELMADKLKEITDYIQQEKLKLKRQSDLVKLFTYYNGLVK